jgi:hypothetical protein
MKNILIQILLTIIGLTLISISINWSHQLWFSESVQNGSGLKSLFIILIGCGVGIGLLFFNFFKENDGAKVFMLIGPLAIHGIMYLYHNNLREQKINLEGKDVIGVITSKGIVSRGKTSSLEIQYYYTVANESYSKYSSDEQFIKNNNLEVDDTIIVRYWIKNPNYHQIKVKYY